jgi:endonuclease III
LWEKYPSRDTDDWEAVGIFLTGYAFERQGAKPDYRHVAVDVVNGLVAQECSLLDATTAKRVWVSFSKTSGGERLNYANNLLCPQGTYYKRKTGSATTYSKSLIESLQDLPKTGLPANIVAFAKMGLHLDCTADVHHAIQSINGIGSKIASLFLRDVAVIYNAYPVKNRYLLQPVDVWVKRVFDKLTDSRSHDTEMIQQGIVNIAIRINVLPEAVNQGMWYFGSQVADSDYRLSKALSDLAYARALIQEYIYALKREMAAAAILVKVRDV